MNATEDIRDREEAKTPPEGVEVVAWEEIEPGRFMPRRVRGSCHGRVLG